MDDSPEPANCRELIVPASLRERFDGLNRGIADSENMAEILREELFAVNEVLAAKIDARNAMLEVILAYQPMVTPFEGATHLQPPLGGGVVVALPAAAGVAAGGSLGPAEPTQQRKRRDIRSIILEEIWKHPGVGIAPSQLAKDCETVLRVVNAAIEFLVRQERIVFDGTHAKPLPRTPDNPSLAVADPEPAPAALLTEAAEQQQAPAEPPEPAAPPPPAALPDYPYTYVDFDGVVIGAGSMHEAIAAIDALIEHGIAGNGHEKLLALRHGNLPFLQLLERASPDLHTELAVRLARAAEKTKPRLAAPPPPAPEPATTAAGDALFEDGGAVADAEGMAESPVLTDRDLLVALLRDNPDGMKMAEIGSHGISATVIYNAETDGVVNHDRRTGLYTAARVAAAAQ